MKRALVVGIDDYAVKPLAGCVNDAHAMAAVLERHGDGSPNFDVERLTSNDKAVNADVLNDAIASLFKGNADIALLYFSGHGLLKADTNSGYLVSQDGRRGAWGASLHEILALANNASPQIKSSVIILDSCQSGSLGEVPAAAAAQISVIGTGVTILTAADRDQAAIEKGGQGVFTAMLLDGLYGGAADICGRITPASVYSHIDQTLGAWEQRPIYKANVQTFITLREVPPKIPLSILRNLPVYFLNPNDEYALDPSFEPDRQNVPEHLRSFPVDPVKTAIFKELQMCNRHGLVVPVDAEHMYYAAINSKACRLTALGAHYRKLAEAGRV